MSAKTKKKSRARKKSTRSSKKHLSTLIQQLDSEQRDSTETFAKWILHLRNRRSPISLDKLIGTKRGTALKWAMPADLLYDADIFINPVPDKTKICSADASTYLEEARLRPVDPVFAIECLAWAHRLPDLASTVDGATWWELFDFLVSTHIELTTIGRPGFWASQLIGAEVPLTLAYLFPELARSTKLAQMGSQFFSESLLDGLDGAGMLPGRLLQFTHQLLACWTRCGYLVNHTKGANMNSSAWEQYAWFVHNALRLTRTDRCSAFSVSRQTAKSKRNLFSAALELTDNDSDRALAKWVLKDGRDKTSVWREPPTLPNEPAYQSDWGEVAILQPGWAPGSPRLVLDYSQNRVRLELTLRGTVTLSGTWQTNWNISNRAVRQVTDWECCCWHSDRDVDLLELECELANGWTWRRQFLMAREDQFLLMADILVAADVSAESSPLIHYCGKLPMPANVDFSRSQETRDGYLRSSKRLGLVLPLSLPEWQADKRVGELKPHDHALVLTQASKGSSLYAPLFIDLHSRRLRRERTWRQLTVAENLKVVPAEVAVGYRAQVGTEQWLFYQSLAKPGNRTVLGQNITCEYLVARVLDQGQSEDLIQVSAEIS